MNRFAILAAAAGLALSTPALAQDAPASDTGPQFYVTGGYSHYDDPDVTFGGITGRVGVKITDNWGVEGEFTTGANDGSLTVPGIPPVDIGVSSQLSGFVVGYLPLDQDWTFIGRIGYSTLDLDFDFGRFGKVTEDFSDLAWGLGVQYDFNDNFGVRGDVTGFKAEGDNLDSGLTLFQIGGVVRF